MPIDSGNLALKGLDDLFSTEENRQEEQREQVQQIPIDALHPFTNHPFKVLDDEAMTRTVESIAQCEENECHFKIGFSAGLLVQQEAGGQMKEMGTTG